MQKIIDGVRLAYDVAGDWVAGGDALVLVHGFGLDRTVWDEPFASLARRCRVIRVDLRGSGESAGGVGPTLMETLAGDVFGLLDALDVRRAVIAGHGMGGYAALAFFRMYAERVAGLALVSSDAGPDPIERSAEHAALAAAIETQGVAAVRDLFLPRALAGSGAATAAVIDRARVIVARQSASGALAHLLGIKQRVDSTDLLEDIRVPAALIAGDRDELVPIAGLERTAAAIGGCSFERLSGVAHLPMLEAPHAVTAALERLTARCAISAQADRRSVRATRV